MPGSLPQGKDYTCRVINTLPIKTALDVGPGIGTYSVYFQQHRVELDVFDCVEVWEPYIEEYVLERKYSKVHLADVREWNNFDYDLVVFGDVLEHMSKEDAVMVWKKASEQAKFAVISIPIVHLEQGPEHGNPYEEHVKPDWSAAEVLETFPHIRRYQVYEHLGVFIADFGYSGDPQEDPDLEGLFADNKDRSGGTEQMVRQFRESILIDLPKFKDYRCLVIPGGIPSVEALLDGTPTIIWIHILPSQISQDAADMLKNPKFQEQVVVMVCVSEWHRDQMIKTTGIDAKKTVVIQNAIKPIISDLDRFQEKIEKPTIIHASSADRAMEILIPAAHRIAYDFDLKIFNDFDPDTAPIDRDIEGIVLDERFTYYNWTPHKTVLKYMSEAHLHAYPAYWLETSCITQIEALSSGLLCVVSDRAVLPETSMGHGMIVGFSGNREEDISNYANNLANAIKLIKAGAWRPQAQVEQIQKFFSWEKAKERWMRLHDAL